MKRLFVKILLIFSVFTLNSCDLTVKDEEGKDICIDDYVKKVGKDRTKIEAEAKNRGIEASAVLLEIYNTSVKTSDKIFDCVATEYYDKICQSTSGKFVKIGSSEDMIKEIKNYTNSIPQDSIDLVFLIDGTGSMGDDIDAVKSSLSSIVSLLSGKQVNISMAIFRDKNVDEIWYERNLNNLVKSDNKEISTFLDKIQAVGGGDFPESLFDGAYKTISELNWSSEGKVLIAITDAAPLTGDMTQFSIDDVINICIDKKVLPLIILMGIK